MNYNLTETQIGQLLILNMDLDINFEKKDAADIRQIIVRGIANQFLSESDVKRLLELLPRMISTSVVETISTKDDGFNNWNEYFDNKQAQYKYEIERFIQQLSHFIFIQNAVHKKRIGSTTKPKRYSKLKTDEQGIKR